MSRRWSAALWSGVLLLALVGGAWTWSATDEAPPTPSKRCLESVELPEPASPECAAQFIAEPVALAPRIVGLTASGTIALLATGMLVRMRRRPREAMANSVNS